MIFIKKQKILTKYNLVRMECFEIVLPFLIEESRL